VIGHSGEEARDNLSHPGADIHGMRLRSSPANYSNFVHEKDDYGRQRDPDGQIVASEEVRGHACPAEASSY